jgi:hypothetical protein
MISQEFLIKKRSTISLSINKCLLPYEENYSESIQDHVKISNNKKHMLGVKRLNNDTYISLMRYISPEFWVKKKKFSEKLALIYTSIHLFS